jgi:hypothetical protein
MIKARFIGDPSFLLDAETCGTGEGAKQRIIMTTSLSVDSICSSCMGPGVAQSSSTQAAMNVSAENRFSFAVPDLGSYFTRTFF